MKEAYTLKEIEEKIEHEKYLRKENQQLYEELQVLRKCSDTTNDLANEYKKELDKYKNIIDELGKWLKANDEHFAEALPFRETLRKLKELKGE